MQSKISRWTQLPKHKVIEGLRVTLENNLPYMIIAKNARETALVRGCVELSRRPCIWVDMSKMTKPGELTQQLWQKAIDLYGWKEFDKLITDLFKDANNARSSGDSMSDALIQGTFRILETLSGEDKNLVVVLEEPEAAKNFIPRYSKDWLNPVFDQTCVKFVLVTRSAEGAGIPAENKITETGTPDKDREGAFMSEANKTSKTNITNSADDARKEFYTSGEGCDPTEELRQQIMQKKFSELTVREKEILLN